MRKGLLTVMITATALLAAACGSTFVASKDGRGYYLGSGSNAAYKMFCESGDLKKILSETQLPQEMKDSMFEYNCGVGQSKEKVKQLFASMTPEQRKDLRTAFKHNGYDINYIPC
jgi:hexokinase